jgi:hypothetical protein
MFLFFGIPKTAGFPGYLLKKEVLIMIDVDKLIAEVSPLNRDKVKWKLDKKIEPASGWSNKLVYDSSSETLEPVYFWLLDLVQGFGWNVEKIEDNFTASPGSGYFAEIGARTTKMQEEGMKILGVVNQVIKSVINIIYDLKEFEIRLKHYNDAKSKERKEEGMLALKQIWMDNVDIKRGRGSINQMSYDLNFVTLRDAFLSAHSVEGVRGLDLNERVKRVLEPRISEFLEWMKRSDAELRKRYEIERSYLKSQVNTLKLYTRWVRPYLKAAEELGIKEVGESRKPWIVNAFNTMVMELSLFNTKEFDVVDAAYNKKLPERFAKLAEKKRLRNMYSVVLIDFAFRGIPRKIPETHYVHGGRVEVSMRSYSLNEDELLLFKDKLKKNEINEALGLAEGITSESLEEITDDVDYFLKKEEREKEEKEKEKEERAANPFTALFGGFKEIFTFRKKEEKKKEDEEIEKEKIKKLAKEGIKPDTYEEGLVRKLTQHESDIMCFRVFDLYKKGHDMASFSIPPIE